MVGRTRLIYDSALKHMTMFKTAVIRDIVVSVLLVQIVAIVAINTITKYNLFLFIAYFLIWSVLFSAHSFRIMPSTKKGKLFLFGIIFLLISFLLSILSDAAIDGIFTDSTTTKILKMIVTSSMISITLIYLYPFLLNYVIPIDQQSIRSGNKNRPYYMFGAYFLVFFVMISLSRLITYGYVVNNGAAARLTLNIILDILLLFSAVVVSSLIFAVYKKGYPHTS